MILTACPFTFHFLNKPNLGLFKKTRDLSLSLLTMIIEIIMLRIICKTLSSCQRPPLDSEPFCKGPEHSQSHAHTQKPLRLLLFERVSLIHINTHLKIPQHNRIDTCTWLKKSFKNVTNTTANGPYPRNDLTTPLSWGERSLPSLRIHIYGSIKPSKYIYINDTVDSTSGVKPSSKSSSSSFSRAYPI